MIQNPSQARRLNRILSLQLVPFKGGRSVIPQHEFIEDMDYAAFTEVLQHLVMNQSVVPVEGIPTVSDFDEKLSFNYIDTAASLLRVGNYQNAEVDKYFDSHGEFTKLDIRNRLAQMYELIRGELSHAAKTDICSGDRVFFGLLNEIAPKPTKSVQDAAIVLIAYFFEKCDVFEDPVN